MKPRKRFAFSNIVGDPFALATISIAIVRNSTLQSSNALTTRQLAWLIAFVSSIITAINTDEFPTFAWWTIVYTFLCIFGIAIIVGNDSVYNYHVAVSKSRLS